jgi:hypothetical protein
MELPPTPEKTQDEIELDIRPLGFMRFWRRIFSLRCPDSIY